MHHARSPNRIRDLFGYDEEWLRGRSEDARVMKGKEKGVERGRPHSERAGEAVLGSGGRATLYRALLELTCSRCGGVIREGDLFTREAGTAGGLLLLRLCRGCVPFEARGGLLDSLLTPEGACEPPPAVPTEDVREKVRSRLGPALDACRRRRDDTGR
jgi:hypothetical protein